MTPERPSVEEAEFLAASDPARREAPEVTGGRFAVDSDVAGFDQSGKDPSSSSSVSSERSPTKISRARSSVRSRSSTDSEDRTAGCASVLTPDPYIEPPKAHRLWLKPSLQSAAWTCSAS